MPCLISLTNLWPTQAQPLAKSMEVTPDPAGGKHHGTLQQGVPGDPREAEGA